MVNGWGIIKIEIWKQYLASLYFNAEHPANYDGPEYVKMGDNTKSEDMEYENGFKIRNLIPWPEEHDVIFNLPWSL